MLAGLFLVLVMSILMTIASLLAGGLPLSLKLSSDKIRLISAFGMGLLIGTSFVVVIPEGVDTVYDAQAKQPINHRRRNLDSSFSWVQQNGKQEPPSTLSRRRDWARRYEGEACVGCAMRRDAPEEAEPEKPEPDEIPAPPAGSPEPSGDEEEEEPPMTESSHTFIGLAMISGFILMYLIDKLPRIASSHLSGSDLPHHISLNNLGAGLQRSSSIGSLENGSLLDPVSAPKSRPPNRRSFTTTLGLVIHALADGIALGASSTSADVSLNLIVFVAIMVHKAPAAFGLTTTLLKQGVSRRRIRTHLLAFSVAAPIGALATWLFMSLISNYTLDPRGPEQPDSKWWTGHLLLFSAGTFMYVAMHGLQEEEDSSKAITSASMLDSDGSASHIRSSSSLETVAAVGGMLLPLLTQFGHHH